VAEVRMFNNTCLFTGKLNGFMKLNMTMWHMVNKGENLDFVTMHPLMLEMAITLVLLGLEQSKSTWGRFMGLRIPFLMIFNSLSLTYQQV
jgi:hypothetical protein